MSYCRFGKDSDVYVIGTRDHLECFGAGNLLETQIPVHERIMCPDWKMLPSGKMVQLSTQHETADIFCTKSRQIMVNHLRTHREAGHIVPDYAISMLQAEIARSGDNYNIDDPIRQGT